MTFQSKREQKKNRDQARRLLGLFLVLMMLVTNVLVPVGMNASAASSLPGIGEETRKQEAVGQNPDAAGVQTPVENETTAAGESPSGHFLEQEAAAQRLAGTQQLQSEEAKEASVTLNLNGGTINGLEIDGWSYAAGVYTKTVEKDSLITLTHPYRSGYTFLGWQLDDTANMYQPDEVSESMTVTIAQDCRLNAVWEEKLYTAYFRNGITQAQLWTVEVPYGSMLWTMEAAPWEAADLTWTPLTDAPLPANVTKLETAEVALSLGEESAARRVQVTRCTQTNSRFYYTFTLEDTPYFTYGGESTDTAGYRFVDWQTIGLDGYAVTEDGKTFHSRYTTKNSYLFHVYYYFENGTKAADPATVVVSEEDVTGPSLTLDVPVPSVQFYTPKAGTMPAGVSPAQNSQTEAGWTGKTVVAIDQAFPDAAATNPSVSIVVFYQPADIDYKVIYHMQKVGEGTDHSSDYVELGSLSGRAKIGSIVSVEDCPKEVQGSAGEAIPTDFQGYEADSQTQMMIRRGQRLEPSLLDDSQTAIIHMYYNRMYFYLYTLTDSNESDPFDPVRVQYGAALPKDQDGAKLVKTGYRFDSWQWYQAGEQGNLLQLGDGAKPSAMPGHDVYAVAHWQAAKTKMQVVYWFEDANSGSFQNTYQKEVEGVPTGDKLVLQLESGKYDLKTENAPIQSFPAFTETFEEAICSKYGDKNASYKQYFTFDPVTTFQEEEQNHHATGNTTGTELHYEVKADGTTTINLYYRRNLYTLQFVLQRTRGNSRQVATRTSGTLEKSGWASLGSADSVFHDFTSQRLMRVETPDSTFGSAEVLKEYRIRDAVNRGDHRAAVGRYAKVQIGAYQCFVYYLTARFEADIAELWPTMENITVDPKAYYSNPLRYISMGSNENSAYWKDRDDQKISNKNILNQYSTMDALIVNDKKGVASPDNQGVANVAHQLYAYWSNNNVKTYQYYFLYETLDTTLDPGKYPEFSVAAAGSYPDGTIVKWRKNAGASYHLYVYRKNNLPQNSTNTIGNQNQPARHGYESMGKAEQSIGNAGNVFYFYKRSIHTLSIYNVNGNWVPEEDILHRKLTLTYVDELTGQTVTGEKSLAELGWAEVVDDAASGEKVIHLRYGARLGVISQNSVTEAFQDYGKQDPLRYPYKSMGVNRYYFHGWYKDQENIVPVDWNANAMQNMIQDQVLYTGWTTPRYRITYALNGGTWTDRVDMTFMILHIEGEPVVLYYPHLTTDPEAEAYWYVPEKKTDYLYMGSFYIAKVGEILDMEHPVDGHYPLKWSTLDEMIGHSSHIKDPGISSGGTSYLCNMGEAGVNTEDTSHRKYIDRHALAGSLLPEPAAPVRNGYDFLGWYAFEEPGPDSAFQQKVWLDEVLGAGEGLHSYQKEYVYLDAAGNAHLLYGDEAENGRLYYYADQSGYQYRFQFGASIASQDRTLYAAWKGQQVNESRTLYLIPKDEIAAAYVASEWKQVTINGTEYYEVFEAERQEGIESGSTLVYQAKPLTTIRDGKIWLPQKAAIHLDIGSNTPQGRMERENVYSHDGDAPVFKVRIPNLDKEAYTYYAYFIYHPVEEPTYTVYSIDLTQAILSGALRDYEDRFDRDKPPDAAAAYVLKAPQRYTYQKNPDGPNEGIVTVNAEIVPGYTVYENWVETLQLESDPSGNNIYFYYVNPENNITFQVTYHFMKNGTYTDDNVVKITGYPGITGQRFDLRHMTEGYEKILDMAKQMRSYAGSSNQAEQDMYQRYKGMRVESHADGMTGSFFVDSSAENSGSSLDQVKALAKDYVLDYYSPSASDGSQSILLTNNAQIHVYLKDARLQINKKDSRGTPLKGARFELKRYRKVLPDEGIDANADVISYEGIQYVHDRDFTTRSGTTDTSGKMIFYDLSTDIHSGYLYQIQELQAPQGHIPLAEPVYATVPYQVTDDNGTTIYYEVTYDIVNPGITYLPKAGGAGVAALLFAGGGIITGGLLTGDILYRRKRKRRKTK